MSSYCDSSAFYKNYTNGTGLLNIRQLHHPSSTRYLASDMLPTSSLSVQKVNSKYSSSKAGWGDWC